MKYFQLYIITLSILVSAISCKTDKSMDVSIYQSSKQGDKFKKIELNSSDQTSVEVEILPDEKYQKIIGFGGSFTEASAYLLNQLSQEKRNQIINAYFSQEGANYSLTRTHINSCDFSLSNYSYAKVKNDTDLTNFSIDEDREDLIPMIKLAQKTSKDGFKIISSPWTAPPWMKDNNDWKGGKLLPEFYDTWALYFSKYIEEYKKEEIDIWGISVENEPLGNDHNWESMHYTPKEMSHFVNSYLGPKFKDEGIEAKILGYDQNRNEELYHWADEMYNGQMPNYFDGIALHWYASTYEVFPKALDYVHKKAPNKLIIQTEACIDAEVPKWKNDEWYWSAEATDWGYDWAPEDKKYLHLKYIPVQRYAEDIIGCLNHHVEGWIDWNMVLNKQGGPNWANNWCIAPIIVDEQTDEVYYTPLYYTMMHFSKFIRPGASRIGFSISDENLKITAVENLDGSIVVVIYNPLKTKKIINLNLSNNNIKFVINNMAIQTIILKINNGKN